MKPRCRHLAKAYSCLVVAIDALEQAGRPALAEGATVVLGHVMKHAPMKEAR